MREPQGMRALVEGVEVDGRHWICGRRVVAKNSFKSISPIDEQPIADVAAGSEAEIDQAVNAAQAAFQSWKRTSPAERAAYLHRIADIVESRVEQLAVVETRDNGSLLRSVLWKMLSLSKGNATNV